MTKLKPCPFCGGEVWAREFGTTGACLIHCTPCGLRCEFDGKLRGLEATIRAWNKRGEIKLGSMPVEIARLKEAIDKLQRQIDNLKESGYEH